MIDRNDRHHMCALAKPQKPFGDDARGEVGCEIDDRLGAKLGQRQRCGREIGAKLGIESVLTLKQKGERPLRNLRAQAAL